VHRAKCSARIIDYMAMGNAILTSAVGENCEYIVDGESGVLARPADEADFSAKLELLLRDSSLRLKLGQNAEERVRSKFTWHGDALQQCLAAYEHALHHGKQSNLSHARCPESSS
jgi:glycosyltransferase involved in cell wall biosynthesis